jgi:general secretion pathway protein D
LDGVFRTKIRIMRLTQIATVLLLSTEFVLAGPPAHITTAQQKREAITQRMKALRLSRVEFKEASVEEALEFLRMKARDADPQKQGINIMLKLPEEEKAALPKISLSLADVPLSEALRYVAQLGNLMIQVEAHAAVVTSISYASTELITRTYNVPPNFLSEAGSLK